jgi:hypothetical protein
VTRPVLICTTDPLAAALLAAAVALDGQDPSFPEADEPARSALLRLRPALVLMDCDFPEACGDSFVGPALMLDVRIVLLRSPRSRMDPSAIAANRGLEVLFLPSDQDALADLLRRASA